ncbi:uncharacterized protein LOC121398226 [Xenopus laevis]|uniref:Uncharacterized protein LOC121398226 n=1 Tax=Xenopus laevis TaxID=8355 RepID=A0A8J1LVH9_XENLA|nr:uncharacterized protein LOC121398226 [Xenopus laevis]
MKPHEKFQKLQEDYRKGLIDQKSYSEQTSILFSQPNPLIDHRARDAPDVFSKMRQNVYQQMPIKKKMIPQASSREASKNLLKIKLCPMQWVERTKSRPGRYIKIILDEEPPRVLLKKSASYDDIIKIGIDNLWHDKEKYNASYTLCLNDGCRWPKADFLMEHETLGDVHDVWKKTFYIGRRNKDTIPATTVSPQRTGSKISPISTYTGTIHTSIGYYIY